MIKIVNSVIQKPPDRTGKSGLDVLFTALANTRVQDAQASSHQVSKSASQQVSKTTSTLLSRSSIHM